MKPLDLRLAVPAAVAWIGAAVIVGAPELAGALAIALWVTAVVLVGSGLVLGVGIRAGTGEVVARRGQPDRGVRDAGESIRRSASRVLVTVAFVVAASAGAATSIALHLPSRSPEVLDHAGGRPIVIEVVTEQTLLPAGGGDARGGSAAATSRWRAAAVVADGQAISVPVAVIGPSPTERVEVGETVAIRARAVRTDPGDTQAYLLLAEGKITSVAAAPAWQSWAGPLRAAFTRVAAGLPGDGGDLLPGLATGDTAAVGPDLDDAMITSSLSHLTAVSGSNCAVLVALALLAGRVLGLPRGIRIGGALVLLGAFVVLVTPEPSVVRAAAMAVAVLVAMAAGRPLRGVPVLGLAVLALVIVDPWLSRSAGFALSVLATAGLLVLAPPLVDRLTAGLPRAIAVLIAVPVAAQIACQPVLSALDPSIAAYGVIANLLAEPAAPLATVLGLIACMLAPLAPPLAHAVAVLAWLPAAWIAAVARLVASVPGARIPWWDPPIGPLVLAVATALITVALVARGRVSQVTAMVLVLGVVAGVGALAGYRVAWLAGRPAQWQIAMCDVGQGDAVVLRSAGRTALVDTGPDPDRLVRCLDDLGIGRLDLVVLTHFDHDHVGGASALRGRATEVLVGPTGEAADDRLLADLAASGSRVRAVHRGDAGVLGEWAWRVLWPPDGRIEPGNGASVTVTLVGVGECAGGCLSAILLGDLGAQAQRRVMAAGPVPRVDVVKVSHHGSADQDPGLYRRLSATIGLIGVGQDNGYGHPTTSALKLLDAAGTTVERTDRCGLILLAPAADRAIRTWTERPCADGIADTGPDGGGG